MRHSRETRWRPAFEKTKKFKREKKNLTQRTTHVEIFRFPHLSKQILVRSAPDRPIPEQQFPYLSHRRQILPRFLTGTMSRRGQWRRSVTLSSGLFDSIVRVSLVII